MSQSTEQYYYVCQHSPSAPTQRMPLVSQPWVSRILILGI